MFSEWSEDTVLAGIYIGSEPAMSGQFTLGLATVIKRPSGAIT
jgi:hypothetical protein